MSFSLLGFSLVVFSSLSFAQTKVGVITGSVLDAQTGRPITGVAIAVDGNEGFSSNTDGRFRIEIGPGVYNLRFRSGNYLESTVEKVEVKLGEATEASTILTSKESVTTVNVVEKVGSVISNAEAMLTERKLAVNVSDSISSDEIRKSVASDAAAALTKVTGVSVVDNGYVYVRGLGERYSSTVLNNAVIPSTEPEKRVIPLDLFPAALIDSIRVLKSYSPDLPGEFSGGLVQMTTIDFPTAKIFRVSASTGFNSRSTFKRGLTYPGGSRDAFGFDDGTRGLPSALPADKRLFPGSFTPQQFQEFGRSFANNWEPTEASSMRPNQNYSMVGGGTYKKFGVVGAITFTNRPYFQGETQRYLRQEGTRPIVFTNYEHFDGYTESARMGAVLNVAYQVNASNKIVLRNTLTHDTDKEAREFSGYDGSADTFLSSQRLRWVERGLASSGLEGEHAMAKLGNALLKWQMTYSKSTRDEPDMREVIRGRLPNGNFTFAALSSSGQRFFNNLSDTILEPQVELSRPFFKGFVTGLWKVGFRGTIRDRDFQARRFRYIPQRSSTLNLLAPSNQLFASSNIRPDGFQIVEFTRASDRYDASMDIYAGYAMADVALGSKWRVVGGMRIEDADIQVNTLDPLVPNAKAQQARLVNRDPVGGANAIYSLTKRQNLRFGFSHNVSRPDFRELSPFDFNNVYGGFVTQGNPNLVRATVNNYDARWEYFLGGSELIAASYFVKDFTNPIEVTILPSNDLRQTYVNAAGATNRGLELEARFGLGRLRKSLRTLGAQANFTFVDSNIRIRPSDATLLTSKDRPLLGQSRYVSNVMLEWKQPKLRSNARFDVNYVSKRISDVGTFGLPDIFQEGNTFIDFSYEFSPVESGRYTIRFTGENLGDNHYHWTQGSFLQRSYYLGRTFTIGMGFRIF